MQIFIALCSKFVGRKASERTNLLDPTKRAFTDRGWALFTEGSNESQHVSKLGAVTCLPSFTIG